MDKLLQKILEVVDYSQEAKNNIDIVLFLTGRIKEIVELAKSVDDNELDNLKNAYLSEYLPQLIEDELAMALEKDVMDKIVDELKKRG